MKSRLLTAAVAAAALASGLLPGTALANKMVYNVSGEVTSPPVGQEITVNGQTYQIAPGSAAETQVTQVVQGENVQLVLTGPANSSSTQVVAIHETPSN
jgi:hypothetical protein